MSRISIFVIPAEIPTSISGINSNITPTTGIKFVRAAQKARSIVYLIPRKIHCKKAAIPTKSAANSVVTTKCFRSLYKSATNFTETALTDLGKVFPLRV